MFVNIIITFSIYLIIGQSFAFIYNTSRFFNITHASVLTLGGYFMFQIYSQLNISFFFSLILSIILALFMGLLMELIIFKKFRKKNTPAFNLLIASLGIYIVIQNCISIIWGNDTKILIFDELNKSFEIFDGRITYFQLFAVLVCFLLFIISVLILKCSKIGRNIRAISSNSELANILGIKSDKVILQSYFIGSGMVAFIGIITLFDTGLTPNIGFNLLFYGIIAMIIGGIGSTWGILASSFLLSASQHLSSFYMGNNWMDTIVFFVLILFLIWKPLGFRGTRLKKVEI